MKSTICLLLTLLVSGNIYSQNTLSNQDSIWTFIVKISQYPFVENNGCTPGRKVSNGIAKCNVISSNYPVKLNTIYVYNFSLIKRALNQKDSIPIRGHISEQPFWDLGCFGKLNSTRRMYIIPIIQQTSF
jgi:hypothetical protein